MQQLGTTYKQTSMDQQSHFNVSDIDDMINVEIKICLNRGVFMNSVLIAYYSKTGSTKEIAEEIGKILVARGFQTEIKDLTAIQELGSHCAVIVGAPINGFRWVPEAEKFIDDHKSQLEKIQTAYFMVSYLLKTGRDSLRNKMLGTLNKAKATVPPVSTGYFGGKVGSDFPAIARLMFGVKKGAPLDVRDWDEIRVWAEALATKLKK